TMKILERDNIDIERLYKEMSLFLSSHNFWEQRQISITSITGDNDWTASIGKIADLDSPERMYSQLNKDLEGTYIAELVAYYKKYYRWRLLHIPPGQTYSIHSDAFPQNLSKINKRIHIPICTNADSYFCYYGDKPSDGVETTVRFHHMPVGSTYEVDTNNYHTAVNFGKTSRYHLVGVRYEK
ncbi:hypothetical protein N9I01_00415, partial [bacterium]|nr:hypothetical protein [bacterium]